MLTRIGAACGATLALLMATTATAIAHKHGPPPVADTQDVTLGLRQSHHGPGSGGVTATSPASLARGTWYVAEVQGTGSFYKASLWLHPRVRHHRPGIVCGTPEPAPMFNRPWYETGRVGFDAETMFARITRPKTCAGDPLPRTTRRFQVKPSHAWRHPTPLDGRHTTPAPDHAYSYPIQGRGVPVAFRELDRPTRDNYGVFRIHLRRATDADCAGSQWRSFADEHGHRAFDTAAACGAAV